MAAAEAMPNNTMPITDTIMTLCTCLCLAYTAVRLHTSVNPYATSFSRCKVKSPANAPQKMGDYFPEQHEVSCRQYGQLDRPSFGWKPLHIAVAHLRCHVTASVASVLVMQQTQRFDQQS